MKRILGEGLWVATGQGLTLVGRLAGIRVLTELVSPAVFGHVSLLLGASVLVAGMLVSPLVQATVRFYPDAVRDARASTLRALSSRSLRFSSLVSTALLLAAGVVWALGRDEGPSVWAFVFLGLGFLADAARTYETGLLNASRRQAPGSLWLAADAWLRPFTAVGIVLLAGSSAAAVLAGYAVGSLGANLLFSRQRVLPAPAEREGDARWAAATSSALRAYALPLAPLAIMAWAFNVGDRYVLASAAGADATGLYSAAYGLASMPFLALSGVLVTTFRPVLFEAVAGRERQKERRILFAWIALTLGSGIAGVVLLAWLAPWVVRVALGNEFRVVAPLLPWIGAAYAVQNVQNVFETRIYARRRTGSFLVLSAVAAAVAVSLYLLLIPRVGAMGAAWGTLGGMTASFLASVLLARLPEKPVAGGAIP